MRKVGRGGRGTAQHDGRPEEEVEKDREAGKIGESFATLHKNFTIEKVPRGTSYKGMGTTT